MPANYGKGHTTVKYWELRTNILFIDLLITDLIDSCHNLVYSRSWNVIFLSSFLYGGLFLGARSVFGKDKNSSFRSQYTLIDIATIRSSL